MSNRIPKGNRASLTVEAALVLPIFIYTIVMLLGIYKVIRCQEAVQEGITQSARATAGYGMLFSDFQEFIDMDETRYENIVNALGIKDIVRNIADSSYFSLTTRSYIDDKKLMAYGVRDGYGGLDFNGSRILDEEGYTDLICNYDLVLHTPIFIDITIHMKQRVKLLSFCGMFAESRFEEEIDEKRKDEEETEEDEVYITETGKTYHEIKTCRHLKINITSVRYKKVGELRNENGAKYYSCDRCSKGSEPGSETMVYITTDGKNYHIESNCPGLKRTIITVKRSEVGNRKACKSCSGNNSGKPQ